MEVSGEKTILNPYEIKSKYQLTFLLALVKNGPLDRGARDGEGAVVSQKGSYHTGK